MPNDLTRPDITCYPLTGDRVRDSHGHIGQTLDYALLRLRISPERTALDTEGIPCGPRTLGPLTPAPTIATSLRLIGKESRGWRDDRNILGTSHYVTYDPPPTADQLAELREKYDYKGGAAQLARDAGIPQRTAQGFIKGRSPAASTAAKLMTIITASHESSDPSHR